MKNIFKKIACYLLLFATLGFCPQSYAKEEKEENFNFIKSEEETENFVYDGSLLLYGGIGLIIISIGGMVITIISRNKKGERSSNRRCKK